MKRYFILLNILLITIFACSNNNKTLNIKKILWEVGGVLPAQKDMQTNIGTAGVLYGTLANKYIVVGGGANFPFDSVANGGAKKLYSDIYMLENKNGNIEVVEHINLDNEIGYGSSITTKDAIYYIGGSANNDADNDILKITLQNNKLNIEKIGDLPFTFQNGVALEYNNKLYIIAGKQDSIATNRMFEYDLNSKEIKELAPIPNEARTQPVAQVLNRNIYVFSGGDKIAYIDGYKYNFSDNTWSKVADVNIGGEYVSLLGANSIKLNEDEMLVIGGFNKEVYDDAVYNLINLKDKDLENFKKEYFARDPNEFNWNSKVLIYNSKNDTWTKIADIPFNAPCGEGLVLLQNKIYSINGEIKPGVRTPKIYIGYIN